MIINTFVPATHSSYIGDTVHETFTLEPVCWCIICTCICHAKGIKVNPSFVGCMSVCSKWSVPSLAFACTKGDSRSPRTTGKIGLSKLWRFGLLSLALPFSQHTPATVPTIHKLPHAVHASASTHISWHVSCVYWTCRAMLSVHWTSMPRLPSPATSIGRLWRSSSSKIRTSQVKNKDFRGLRGMKIYTNLYKHMHYYIYISKAGSIIWKYMEDLRTWGLETDDIDTFPVPNCCFRL